MFLKFFSKKLIGFSIDKQTLRYALITVKQNKIIVEESHIFSINCKTALHRLQHLLTLYPSCFSTSATKSLLATGAEDIKSKRDRQIVVKNKIESLLPTEEICLSSLDGPSSKSVPYFCLKQNTLIEMQNLYEKLLLLPQKCIVSSQALLSLEYFFAKPTQKKVLLYFSKEDVELLFLIDKKLKNSVSFSTKNLTPQKIIKRVLKEFYLLFPEKETIALAIHGSPSFLEELLQAIKGIPYLKLDKSLYGSFETEHPEFLIEIGAAFGLLGIFKHNFQKSSFGKALKVYKRPIFIQSLLICGIFFLSLFSWNLKISQIEAQNTLILEKSFSTLGKKLSKEQSLNSTHVLNKLLKEKQKATPSYQLQTNDFSVTETLMWIATIFNKVKEERSPPFIIENFKYCRSQTSAHQKGKKPQHLKVAITFSADNSPIARKVYDEICKSKHIVDTTKKIDWSYQNNQYQATFFLKNKGTRKKDA